MNGYKFRKPRGGPARPRKRVLVDDGPAYRIGLLPMPRVVIVCDPIPDEPDAPTLRLAGALLELIAERKG